MKIIKRVLKALMMPFFISLILFFISLIFQKYLLALIFFVIFVISNLIFYRNTKDKMLLYHILISKVVLSPEDLKGKVTNSDKTLKKLIEQGMVEVRDNKIILLKERYKVFNQVFWRSENGNGNTKPNYSSFN